MFPVRYELNLYINLLRNSVFKGLIKYYAMMIYGRLEVRFHVFLISALGGGDVWSQFHAPGTNCVGGCEGPRLGVKDVEKTV
jgi:hypothetical protein